MKTISPVLKLSAGMSTVESMVAKSAAAEVSSLIEVIGSGVILSMVTSTVLMASAIAKSVVMLATEAMPLRPHLT